MLCEFKRDSWEKVRREVFRQETAEIAAYLAELFAPLLGQVDREERTMYQR